MVKIYRFLYCSKCGKTVKTKRIKDEIFCRRCGNFIIKKKELGKIGS